MECCLHPLWCPASRRHIRCLGFGALLAVAWCSVLATSRRVTRHLDHCLSLCVFTATERAIVWFVHTAVCVHMAVCVHTAVFVHTAVDVAPHSRAVTAGSASQCAVLAPAPAYAPAPASCLLPLVHVSCLLLLCPPPASRILPPASCVLPPAPCSACHSSSCSCFLSYSCFFCPASSSIPLCLLPLLLDPPLALLPTTTFLPSHWFGAGLENIQPALNQPCSQPILPLPPQKRLLGRCGGPRKHGL